ncbi:MAG TPA: phenylalanine--tRNA ligase subunit beta, partial [Thermosipho africanus]|nr:phenylalanine--tRNA ligase subunit beta [Thermosipho africanus]
EMMDKFYDVKDEVYALEISTQPLYENYFEVPEYRESSQFPSVRRDVSLLVPNDFLMGKVIEGLYKYKYVEEAGISDVYTGKGIEEGYKSVTVYCVFRAEDKTLSEDEVNKIWEKIKKDLIYKYPLKLRFEEV